MNKRVFYYSFNDFITHDPTQKITFESVVEEILGVDAMENIFLPEEFDGDIADNLITLVLQRFHRLAVARIVKFTPFEPSEAEKQSAFKDWFIKFLNMLNETWDYYYTLINNYAGAKADLMADIKATSKNKVKFNDTPQNPNTAGVYEGDNYITHFTFTEGENSSPLMSKMMRLKEIQENYRDLMSEWVNDFHRIFYEEDC